MSGDLPDDWFRPSRKDEQAGAPESQSESAPAKDVPAAEDRYTDQFKPNWNRAELAATRKQPATSKPPGPRRATPAPSPPDTGPSSIPVLTTASLTAGTSGAGEGDRPTPQQRPGFMARHPGLLALAALLLAVLVGLSTGQLIQHQVAPEPTTQAPTTTGGSPVSSQTPEAPWERPTKPMKVQRVEASCTAPEATDSEGRRVTYVAAHVLDSDPETAWRCNGNAVGQRLVFTVPAGTELVGVGVANGYVKTVGSVSLYDQYRRVSSLRWDLPDGSFFIQNLSENSTSVQQLLIPPRKVSGEVRLTVLVSTPPGSSGEATRDAVLLSTVQLYSKG